MVVRQKPKVPLFASADRGDFTEARINGPEQIKAGDCDAGKEKAWESTHELEQSTMGTHPADLSQSIVMQRRQQVREWLFSP